MKRVGREPSPTDMGLKMLNERIKALEELKTLCDTDEFRSIANLVEQHSTGYGTPDIVDKGFKWSPYMSQLNRWTDERLCLFVDAMTALSPDKQEMKESKDYFNRDYIFTWEFEDDHSLVVALYAYEKSETSECRKIQVGTKMVEQAIYRYDCVAPEGNSGELPAPILAIDL